MMKNSALLSISTFSLLCGCQSSETQLRQSLREDDAVAVRAAIERGADAFLVDRQVSPFSPVAEAAVHGWGEDIPLLKAAGVDLNQPDIYGWRAIHYAVASAQPTVVAALLEAKVNANAALPAQSGVNSYPQVGRQYEPGATPLIMAAQGGCRTCVKLLLQYGAKADAKDGKGRTALWYLGGKLTSGEEQKRSSETRQIRSLLLKAGADPNARDHTGQTGHQAAAAERQRAWREDHPTPEEWQRRLQREHEEEYGKR